MLTEEQRRFLARYINSRGDFYGSVNSLGLDIAHIISWQESNPEFDREYRATRIKIIDFIKQENHILAIQKVNSALKEGVTVNTISQKHKITENGSEFETTRTTKNLGVPGWAIVEALKESSLTKAINTLANEGVLPSPIARRLLQNVSTIQTSVRESFDVKDTDYVNEEKAINLIKAAVFGDVDI